MRKVLGAGLIGVVVVFAAAPTRAAHACDCAGTAPQILLPRDGATNVPTNARVLVTAEKLGMDRWAGTDATRTPKLGIAPKKGGAAVKAMVGTMMSEAWGTVYVVTPARPLKAGTAYQLVVLGKTARDRKAVSGFTTGKVADTAPPVFAGIDRFTAIVAYRGSTGSKCDGQPPFEELTWRYDVATDDGTDPNDLVRILYVQRKGESRAIKLIEPFDAAKPVLSVDDTTCAPFHQIMKTADEMCATIEVVDLAGNVAGAAVEKCTTAKKM